MMTESTVISLPASVSDRIIDVVMRDIRSAGADRLDRVTFDMNDVGFVDPAGMLALLDLLRWMDQKGIRSNVKLPGEKVVTYLERMDFWKHLKKYEVEADYGSIPDPGGSSNRDVLLETTPVRETDDVHRIIRGVREEAGVILEKNLNYPDQELDRFLTAISEICQNIVEHSGDEGFVAVQKYFYRDTLGRNVVKMAVSDMGIGIEKTLRERFQEKAGEEWSDRMAIEKAMSEQVSRFDDPGRGHGLKTVRESTGHWNGRLSLRSGTARVTKVPDWDDRTPDNEEDLPEFPGTRVILLLPAKTADEAQKSLF